MLHTVLDQIHVARSEIIGVHRIQTSFCLIYPNQLILVVRISTNKYPTCSDRNN